MGQYTLDREDFLHKDAFELIWPDGVNAARKLSRGTYTSTTGIQRSKTRREIVDEQIVAHTLSRVLWRLSGNRYTPHHWFLELMSEVNEGEDQS